MVDGTLSSTHLSSSSIDFWFVWINVKTEDLLLSEFDFVLIFTELNISVSCSSLSSSSSSKSSLSSKGENAKRWAFFDGLHKIIIIKRIKENKMCQKPSSNHSSFQSLRHSTNLCRTKDQIINITLDMTQNINVLVKWRYKVSFGMFRLKRSVRIVCCKLDKIQ